MARSMKKDERKKRAIRFLRSFGSLVLTLVLLVSLLENLGHIQEGRLSQKRILFVVFESIAIFLLTLLMPKSKSRPDSKRKQIKRKKREEKTTEELHKRIKTRVKLNVKYSPNIISKCDNCNFENPARTEICFNCGSKLKELNL